MSREEEAKILNDYRKAIETDEVALSYRQLLIESINQGCSSCQLEDVLAMLKYREDIIATHFNVKRIVHGK